MKIKEPKFVLSKNKVKSQIDKLKNHFDEISYSWKTNPQVGRIIVENHKEVFHSIHSLNELKQYLNSKGEVYNVWFFGLAWNNDSLDELTKLGVKNFVVDNTNDLDVLLDYIDDKKIKINLLLRMKLRENTIFTGKHYVFGMRVREIKEHIPKLKENQNIEKLGLHFHRKTQNVSEWSLKQEVAQSLGEEILKKIDYMNLGGGLPGNYENIHDRAIESIFLKTDELRNYVKEFNIKLIIEPGRFIAAAAIKLESYIIAVHEDACFVNVSVFNGMLDTIVANIKLKILEENENRIGNKYTIKGCTPDSSDILRYSVYLDNPKVGNKITFLNCGAYTYTTDFCALDKIKTEVVK